MTDPTPPRSPRADKYPEFLSDLADTITENLLRRGIAPEIARESGDDTAEHMRKMHGGSIIYIPEGLRQKIAVRNAEIRRDLKAGVPRKDVRRKHGLSDNTLRRIEREEE